jgi:hypothetical protein
MDSPIENTSGIIYQVLGNFGVGKLIVERFRCRAVAFRAIYRESFFRAISVGNRLKRTNQKLVFRNEEKVIIKEGSKMCDEVDVRASVLFLYRSV